jgi:hypothetical protein
MIRLLAHTDPRIQEQALNIVRSLSENKAGIDLVFSDIGIDLLLDRLRAALESSDDDAQAVLALAIAASPTARPVSILPNAASQRTRTV